MIKFVSEIFKTDKSPSVNGDNTAMLEVNGVCLNIWWNQPNETASVKFEGVGVKSVLSILEMKKKYQKYKDIRILMKLLK